MNPNTYAYLLIAAVWFSPLHALERVNLNSAHQQALGNSYSVKMDASGRYLTFESDATNLVSGDTNNTRDVFLLDHDSGGLERVSIDSNENQGNSNSHAGGVSNDGRYVVFDSLSTLVGGVPGTFYQIYLRDRALGTTQLLSVNASGVAGNNNSLHANISADGQWVAFHTYARNLAAGDSNFIADVYLRNVQSGVLTRISATPAGGLGDGDSLEANLNGDGRYIVFVSYATNLTGQAVARQRHVYLRDRLTGITTLISRSASGAAANGGSYEPSISADGRYIVYYTLATNLTATTPTVGPQVVMYDTQTGQTELISRTPAGAAGNDQSYGGAVSGDGRFVTFTSYANNLVADDTNGHSDAMLLDRSSGEMKILSRSAAGLAANGDIVSWPSINSAGDTVAFVSYGSNLVADDTNSSADVFLYAQASNAAPTAVAGPAQRVACAGRMTDVTLDGRGSTDPDGDELSYLWRGDFGVSEGAVVSVPLGVGNHLAGLTVDDGHGGTDEDQSRVEVYDATPPNVSLAAAIDLEAESTAGAAYTLNPVVADLCSAVAVAITPSITTYPLGETVVTVTASDTSGNSQSATQTVRVVDTTPPTLSVPPDVGTEASAVQTPVALGQAVASDLFSVTLSNDAPAAFSLGVTQVTWRAEDSNQNVATGLQRVTVVDTTAPTLTAPADLQREATAVRTPVVLGMAEASDIFPFILSNDAPADFALGATTVTWRAVDGSGNTTTAVQQVTIVDTIAPTLTAPADIVAEATAVNSVIDIGTAQASDIFLHAVTHNAPASFPLGTTVVTWRADDDSGNTATATQRVSVRDTLAPVIAVPADMVVEAQGEWTRVYLPQAGASDVFPVTVSNDAPAAFPLGRTRITWRAVDSNGNVATAVQSVSVVDTTAPSSDIEQLRSEIWPPNEKLVEVLRVSRVTDLVDPHPSVEVEVDYVESRASKQRNSHANHGTARPVHGDHDRRGGGVARDEDERAEVGSAGHDRGRAYDHAHRPRKDWRVVETAGVWHIYVRASIEGYMQQRLYSITLGVADASGNRSEGQYEVVVSREKKSHR